MKRFTNVFALILTVVIAFSCTYDDRGLRNEIDLIKADVANLKKQTTAIQEVIDAHNKGKYITAIDEQSEKNSYKITFSDGNVIEVKDGKTVPVIGVQEEDGIYYWTITTDGKTTFLLDNNKQKLPVSGKPGEAPELGIDTEGYWTVNGKRVVDANSKEVKAQGDAFFKKVENKEEAVTFILADGTEINIPKLAETHLHFPDAGGEVVVIRMNEEKEFSFNANNISTIKIASQPKGWTVLIKKSENKITVKALENNAERGEIVLKGIDAKGCVYEAAIEVLLLSPDTKYDDKLSTLILNEGNMTSENGSLIYINPNGFAVGNIYSSINGKELGNVTQDLFINNGKVWIISQNGSGKNPDENEGILVKADLKTMKKEAAFDAQLRNTEGEYKLDQPTHLAVLDDKNVFIRDNKGVSHFDSTTGELTLIEGTRGAAKNRMAVVNNKVFVINGKSLMVFEANKNEVTKTIKFDGNITGVEKSKDNQLWVAINNPDKFIKLNSVNYEVIKENAITVGKLSRGWGSGSSFSAKADTLYYNNAGTTIYRHIFSQNKSEEMVNIKDYVQNANIVYNGIGVHPITGDVYINTLKNYGLDYLNNEISVFNFDKKEKAESYKAAYKNHTRFPAGIYFPANFN